MYAIVYLSELSIAHHTYLSTANHTGAFTYNTADVAMSPLQAFLSKSEINNLSLALSSSLSKSTNTSSLSKKQDQVLERWMKEGKVPWTEFAVTPSGGAASTPEGNISYVSILTINLVGSFGGFGPFPDTEPFKAPIWAWICGTSICRLVVAGD